VRVNLGLVENLLAQIQSIMEIAEALFDISRSLFISPQGFGGKEKKLKLPSIVGKFQLLAIAAENRPACKFSNRKETKF
jgi:hypothetical protein